MATYRSAADLSRKIEGYALTLEAANRDAVKEAIKVYKERVIQQLKRDVGADQRLSKWKWNWRTKTYKPLKLSAGYQTRGGSQAEAVLRARPRGPWMVLEKGAEAHVVVPKPIRERRVARSGERATRRVGGSRRLVRPLGLQLPDGNVRRRVETRRTRPKNTWSKGVMGAESDAKFAFENTHKQAIAKHASRR